MSLKVCGDGTTARDLFMCLCPLPMWRVLLHKLSHALTCMDSTCSLQCIAQEWPSIRYKIVLCQSTTEIMYSMRPPLMHGSCRTNGY